jgi:hypothetical protein
MAMNRKAKIHLFSMLLITIVFGSALALVHNINKVTESGNIKASWNLALWNVANNTAVNNLNWTDIEVGTVKQTKDIFGDYVLKIKNLNPNAGCYVAWALDNSTPLPNGTTISATYEQSANTWMDWPQNWFGTIYILPNALSGPRVEWALNASLGATTGNFAFNILLLDSDNMTG